MLVLRAGIRVSKSVKVRERGYRLSFVSRDSLRSGLQLWSPVRDWSSI